MSPRIALATSCTSALGKLSVTSLGPPARAPARFGPVKVCVPGKTSDCVWPVRTGLFADGVAGGPSAMAALDTASRQSVERTNRFIVISLVVVAVVGIVGRGGGVGDRAVRPEGGLGRPRRTARGLRLQPCDVEVERAALAVAVEDELFGLDGDEFPARDLLAHLHAPEAAVGVAHQRRGRVVAGDGGAEHLDAVEVARVLGLR